MQKRKEKEKDRERERGIGSGFKTSRLSRSGGHGLFPGRARSCKTRLQVNPYHRREPTDKLNGWKRFHELTRRSPAQVAKPDSLLEDRAAGSIALSLPYWGSKAAAATVLLTSSDKKATTRSYIVYIERGCDS